MHESLASIDRTFDRSGLAYSAAVQRCWPACLLACCMVAVVCFLLYGICCMCLPDLLHWRQLLHVCSCGERRAAHRRRLCLYPQALQVRHCRLVRLARPAASPRREMPTHVSACTSVRACIGAWMRLRVMPRTCSCAKKDAVFVFLDSSFKLWDTLAKAVPICANRVPVYVCP